MASAQYRLIAADGTELEAGAGDVAFAGGVLELQPADGAALRVQAAAIASVGEPEPYTVLVTLADGAALELSLARPDAHAAAGGTARCAG